MFCKWCGVKVEDTQAFCSVCGGKLQYNLSSQRVNNQSSDASEQAYQEPITSNDKEQPKDVNVEAILDERPPKDVGHAENTGTQQESHREEPREKDTSENANAQAENNTYKAEEANSKVEYAGFWIRAGAYMIDSLLLLVVLTVLVIIFISTVSFSTGDDLKQTFGSIFPIVSLLIGTLYFALMESSEQQATFGKKWLGLKVESENGNRITFENAVGRYFGKILSSFFFIGFIMVVFTKKKQGLHDKLAETIVVLN